jgi:hypothetical protein
MDRVLERSRKSSRQYVERPRPRGAILALGKRTSAAPVIEGVKKSGTELSLGPSISGEVSIGPGKTACPTEHIVTEPRFEFVKLLLIDLAVAARVEIDPKSAPD